MSTQPQHRQKHQDPVRRAGFVLLAGMVATVGVTLVHPAGEDPNDHVAVFAEYARDPTWIATHLGQFVTGLVIVGGIALLAHALATRPQAGPWPQLALVAAGAATAALAFLQAVDGVMLKEAVDAWASAGPDLKPAAFADAELARALEWGANAVLRMLQGTAVLFAGVALARSGLMRRGDGIVLGAAGVAYLALGPVVASDGFSPLAMSLALVGDVALFAGAVLVAWGDRSPGARFG